MARKDEIMEIKKKQVTKEYWDCGIADHMHRKKDTAVKCIEKHRRSRSAPQSISALRTTLRNIDIFERIVINEEKPIDLAKEYGLSKGSISQVTRNLGYYGLYRAGKITKFEYLQRRGILEWKKNKTEAKELIEKARKYNTKRLEAIAEKFLARKNGTKG